jgi:hypothetical protein
MFLVERGVLVELQNTKHSVRKLACGDSYGQLSMMWVLNEIDLSTNVLTTTPQNR